MQILKKLIMEQNVTYIDNKKNRGMAYALNCAVQKGHSDNAEWLLLMDQDSIITSDAILKLYQFAKSYPEDNLAIVAANYHPEYKGEIAENIEVITSGSLIHIDTCIKLGFFREDLFIDEIDNEYCLRVLKNGYKICRMNKILFLHSIGNKKYTTHGVTYNYPPERYYYLVRNPLLVAEEYGNDFPDICHRKKKRVHQWFHIVFLEKYKIKKYLFMLKGIWDYKVHRTGIFPWTKYK